MEVFLLSIKLEICYCLMIFLFFIIPFFIAKLKNKYFTFSYMFIYYLFLIIGVLFKVTFDSSKVYISLLYTKTWFNNSFSLAFLDPLSVILNILLLFPIGFTFPIFNKYHSYKKIILFSFFVSLSIEILQFSLPIQRYPELLDILNNTFSGILGYQYYFIINTLMFRGEYNGKLSKQKTNQ